MFEEMTFEVILNKMLASVSSDVDKREGSVIYDALAPAAIELTLMYTELDNILNESFADTSSREYLIRRASERGLTPETATCAELKGEFTPETIDVLGERFSCGELNYVVTEKLASDKENTAVYKLQCETEGVAGNKVFGTLLPINYITGLQTAELVELITPGEDEEDTETFRQRYFDSLESQAFGGNVADYKQKVKAIDGVGGVRVYRADDWNGGGTVKLVIQNSDFNAPSEELVEEVQNYIDPYMIDGVLTTGTGVGLAPIGHQVTVTGAQSESVDISATFVMLDGYTFEGQKTSIESALSEYITSLNKKWEDEEITVYTANITVELMAVTGVKRVEQVKVNGNAENYTLNKDSVAVLGEVVNDESD